MTPLLWIILFVIAVVLIHLSVNWIMRALDITPAAPKERAGGFKDVLDRLRAAIQQRKSRDDGRRGS